ncbi:MAG: class I SAM-dependent RNA methyltransferase [Anaerolineae bacterium]|nr:class I SAM-dependent RNA methyltransferase [Anaerolineae bacterium]
MTNETFDLELDGMAHGGSALGRYAGRTVFVPYTIPGERVQAHTVSEKGRVIFAEGVKLLEASADRVRPRCPHFGPGRCGRCQWQHIDYPAQLLLKQDVLADQLERIGGFRDADVRPVIASPEQWGYNWRMTFQVINGELGLPMQSPPNSATRGNIPITECHILHPDLLALKESLDLEKLAGLEEIILQQGSDGGAMIVIFMKDDLPPELETDLPMSVNLLLSTNEPVNLIGDTHSGYTLKGRNLRTTAGSFLRPNLAQLDRLVDEVLLGLGDLNGKAVLDLYAGVGVYSAFMASAARLVTLVESYPPAVNDADENLADFDNVDVIEGAVEDVLDALEDHYDAAVIDPPADGLSGDALDALDDLGVPRLVYVSSDPATLARDGKRLAAKGYRLAYAQPIDLAPQTYYIDTVGVFER